MKIRHKFVPIQKKLMLLIILPAMVIAAAGFQVIMNLDLSRLQNELIEEGHARVDFLRDDFFKLIVAGNNDLATELTARLRNYALIESILLYDIQRNPVFSYHKNGSEKNLSMPDSNVQDHVFSDGLLTMRERVIYQGSLYGESLVQISTQKMQTLRNNYLMRGIVFAFAFLLALILLFRQIGRYFLRPVEQLAAVLKHAGESQDFTTQLPVRRNDEVGQLFAGFNRMQKQIKQANKNLLDQKHALDEHNLVTVTDARANITYANQKFVDISGYSQSELLGKNHRIVNSGVHDSEFFQKIYQTITAGQVWQGEICSRAKDGHFYWANTTIVPFMGEHGKAEQFIAIRTNITRQKALEKALRISEERLDMAMSVANDGIWDWHLDDNSVYFDARYYTMAGYQPFAFAAEFEQFQQRVHPDHIKQVLAAVELYLAGESDTFDIEFKFKKENGHYMWIRGRGKIVKRDDNGKPLRFISTHSDINKTKHIEAKLIKSEKRYRQIFESSQAVTLIVDEKDSGIIEANKAAVKFYGYDIATLTSMSINDINVLSKKEVKQKRDVSKAKKGSRLDCRHQLASGEVRDVEVYPGTVKIGKKAYLYLIVQDVSERINAEKQLRRAQKMDAVGQLTGGIAHDFNNILGIISGNITLLERQWHGQQQAEQQEMDEKSQKRIDTIKHSTQRAIDLTRQLLNFSRKEADSVKTVDINQLITSMQDLVKHSLTPQIEVEHKLTEDLWVTKIDPGDFEDALLNLLLNARDAMSGSGKIIIESRNLTLDRVFCENSIELYIGDYVELAVSDSGEGMSFEQQEHIFEPFYTTKKQGKGTGLGLAMVFGFIKRSSGGIKVYSEPGIGTTFRIYLPRHLAQSGKQESLAAENIEQKNQQMLHGNETILVVDDEEALLELVQESLQSLGYRVLTAVDSKQALQILSDEHAADQSVSDKPTTDKQGVDLLFSDVVMPGINGFELAELAHKQYPELKILLTSGYTEKAIADNVQSRFVDNVLSKPYNQGDLAQRLRQMLDNPVKNN